MKLINDGYLLKLDCGKTRDQVWLPMWPGEEIPKTEREMERKLRWLIGELIRQYIEENRPGEVKRVMELAQEEHPELPYEGWENQADWADEALLITDLRYGLRTAAEHPEWLEKMDPGEMEDIDLYTLVAERM